MALPPLASAELIASKSVDVRVNEDGVKRAAEKLKPLIDSNGYSRSSWKSYPLHPQESTRETVDWIFVIDLMNFSFWSPKPGVDWVVQYKGENYTDYWALCASLRRAMDEGIAITTPACFGSLTEEQVRHIFRSESEVELSQLETRTQHFNQAGKVLVEKFGGSFSHCVEQCGHSVAKLLQLIVQNFSSFCDEADFQGTRVAFYKRAQILIADLWTCFEGESWGRFDDIETITMFADYRVPQVLCYHGVLQYSDALRQHLSEAKLVDPGSSYEVEIRGCTIWAVELIRRHLVQMGNNSEANKERRGSLLTSIVLDFYLWGSSVDLHLDDHSTDFPMHRTRTIFY